MGWCYWWLKVMNGRTDICRQRHTEQHELLRIRQRGKLLEWAGLTLEAHVPHLDDSRIVRLASG